VVVGFLISMRIYLPGIEGKSTEASMPSFPPGCSHKGWPKSEGLPQISVLAGSAAPHLMDVLQPGWARHLQASTCTPLDGTSSRGRASHPALWPSLCSGGHADRSTGGIWHHTLGSIAIHRGSVALPRRAAVQPEVDTSDRLSLLA
jgi:hypothetical protein